MPEKAMNLLKIMSTPKNRKHLSQRGFTLEQYMYHLYREKNEESRKLRAAVDAFIKAVSRIPTPSEKARRRKK